MDLKEIRALVSLLDDEDLEVIQHIEQKILSLGDVIIPFLETEWDNHLDQHVQRRIEDLIHHLQFTALHEKLVYWKENEEKDLLKGLWLVATYQYPDLDFKKLKKEIDKIYYEVWLNHRTYASPYDQIKNINHILYSKLDFSSNINSPHTPEDSMINRVLERRRGNAIGICSIYMLVAQQLHIPIYGVNLPNIFILTYKSEEVQFYINGSASGKVLSKAEITSYLHGIKIVPQSQFYEPCSNVEMIRRVLRNLILSFDRMNATEKVDEVKILLAAISQI